MNCGNVQSLLLAYLDGEVTPSERALILAHLSGCTVCQQELDLLSTARSQVRTALQRRALQAAPSREAWSRLEARLPKGQVSFLPKVAQPSAGKAPAPSAAQYRTRLSRWISGVGRTTNSLFSGDITMRKRYILGTSVAILVIAMVAVSMFKNVVPVSAQTILDRATAAQAAETTTQGIEHTRIEIYENPQALEGEQAGTIVINEDYFDPATGYYRFLTQDTTGKILQVAAYDGSFNYSALAEDINNNSITIHRIPQSQDDVRKGQLDGPEITENSLFEHFRTNPRVELLGKETWADGRQVYVLVDRNSQTEKLPNGQEEETFTGTMKVVFDAQTYQLVESETTVYKDGREIVIEKVRFLMDEVLPLESQIAWDLSDLQYVTFVDDPQVEQVEEVSFEVISEQQLAARANAYVLKNIPEGFTQEIVAAADQPQDEPYAYEIHYNGPSDEHFGLQAVGIMDQGFIETSFYDGSYKSAAGLVLNYSSSQPEGSEHGTSAMLTVPDGTSFLLWSTLSRAEVQALVEDLAPLK